jgi:hypothetical protein
MQWCLCGEFITSTCPHKSTEHHAGLVTQPTCAGSGSLQAAACRLHAYMVFVWWILHHLAHIYKGHCACLDVCCARAEHSCHSVLQRGPCLSSCRTGLACTLYTSRQDDTFCTQADVAAVAGGPRIEPPSLLPLVHTTSSSVNIAHPDPPSSLRVSGFSNQGQGSATLQR